jgi:LysM repeat protein
MAGVGLHIIEPGDTLFSLAQRYGTRVDRLARQNVMSIGGILIPGRVLRVPLATPTESQLDSVTALPTAQDRSGTAGPSTTVSAANAVGPLMNPGSLGEHRVSPGETLYGIAARYGLTVDDLLRWNGLTESDGIQAGASLALGTSPGAGSVAAPALAAPIPLIDGGSAPSYSPSRPAPDGNPEFVHSVSAGETLSSIAQLYGETTVSLERLNGLDSDTIYVGQEIRVPAMGLGPEAAPSFGTKRIEIDISEQRMYVWQGDTLVWNLVASSGMAGFTTRRGTFAIQSKIPNAWSGPWQLWMPYWMGIYWAGGSENGIHALPITDGQRLWGGYLGSPISYGCIVLSTEDAMKLYNWVEMGTEVTIRD